MALTGRFEWITTAADWPLAILLVVVAAQLFIGHGVFVTWALAPPSASHELLASFPAPSVVGTVARRQTAEALLALLAYAAVYVLINALVGRRRQIERLVQALLLLGSVIGLVAMLEYALPQSVLLPWRVPASRATVQFANSDHLGTWLSMVICLGLGYLLARQRGRLPRTPLRQILISRDTREQAVRHFLPAFAIVMMVLGLMCTLSRGAVVGLLAGLLVFVLLCGMFGRARWILIVLCVVFLLTATYATWIGFGRLSSRFPQAAVETARRWDVYVSNLTMLPDFPVLGVGLGAYGDIYQRYERRFFPLHNEWLQWLLELGVVGAAVIGTAIWRIGKDLVFAHLLGRAACPVGGGAGEWAQRRDPFSVGIAVGALAALTGLMAHSLAEFSARIPAVSVLAAACLGLATVALHTRFGNDPTRLVATRATELRGRIVRLVISVTAVGVLVILGYFIARPAVVDIIVRSAEPTLTDANRAVTIDPNHPLARALRARLRVQAALRIWNEGVDIDQRRVVSTDERRAKALAELNGAVNDLRTALASRPTIPAFHEALGWTYVSLAMVDTTATSTHADAAIAHFQRALALAPQNASLYKATAQAVAQLVPHVPIDLGLRAARNAIERNAGLLDELVYEFLLLPLSPVQWLQLVPGTAVDRLTLANALERRHLLTEARSAYRAAVAVARPDESAFARWILASALSRRSEHRAALGVLDEALRLDSPNPEIHLARAHALAALGEPDALHAYRAAVANAERMARRQESAFAFTASDHRSAALLKEQIGETRGPSTARYREALAGDLTARRLWDQALTELERLIAETPGSAAARFLRGVALYGLGQAETAVEEFRAAVALDGTNPRFRIRLAQSLWATEQFYQAINEWGIALSQDPNDVPTRLALGRAYQRVGEKTQAVQQFRMILDVAPTHAEARAELARLGVAP